MKQLNWATLGCGVIANELAHALSKEGRTLYSVANRTHEKTVAFAQKYGISKVYDNIDDVFYDPDVDIIYISTPHNTHINYLRKALSNGKHVLCEKSITFCVQLAPVPAITGICPAVSSTTHFITESFSSSVIVAGSPVVPHTIIASVPPSICLFTSVLSIS